MDNPKPLPLAFIMFAVKVLVHYEAAASKTRRFTYAFSCPACPLLYPTVMGRHGRHRPPPIRARQTSSPVGHRPSAAADAHHEAGPHSHPRRSKSQAVGRCSHRVSREDAAVSSEGDGSVRARPLVARETFFISFALASVRTVPYPSIQIQKNIFLVFVIFSTYKP